MQFHETRMGARLFEQLPDVIDKFVQQFVKLNKNLSRLVELFEDQLIMQQLNKKKKDEEK